MKLISHFDAAALGTAELHALRRDAFEAFMSAARGSQERLDAFASLEAIEVELASRDLTL
ncbi:hypothetical protein [Rhodovulum sp. P5]|uniref:hypothetical protein n=1 Tax=Rhodovulum sp. P5 TaxID=1564506 RepID=UPI0009D9973A|nr:hypothetical protein [Rhodovulum sp. P5]